MKFQMYVAFTLLNYLAVVELVHKVQPKLESYNVDPESLTVSGLSSGGLMTPQLHFIFSSEIKGAGIFAGGPYLCGNNPISAALCFKFPEFQSVSELIGLADHYSSSGKIDPLSNLENSKVFIYHGRNDTRAKPGTGRHLEDMYIHYGADVKSEFSINGGHGQPVNGNGFGGSCGTANPDEHYMNDCGYNGAYEMFSWLYGDDIVQPSPSFRGDGDLLTINQWEFVADPFVAGMSDTALIYVPKNCSSRVKKCRFHVALHGCLSNRQYIRDAYATKSQYVDTAELNDIVVLFPQTKITFGNPMGCYDFVGSTGPLFATRWGSQPTVIRKMIKRVMGQN